MLSILQFYNMAKYEVAQMYLMKPLVFFNIQTKRYLKQSTSNLDMYSWQNNSVINVKQKGKLNQYVNYYKQ